MPFPASHYTIFSGWLDLKELHIITAQITLERVPEIGLRDGTHVRAHGAKGQVACLTEHYIRVGALVIEHGQGCCYEIFSG